MLHVCDRFRGHLLGPAHDSFVSQSRLPIHQHQMHNCRTGPPFPFPMISQFEYMVSLKDSLHGISTMHSSMTYSGRLAIQAACRTLHVLDHLKKRSNGVTGVATCLEDGT
jgi:hypothetical protein